MAAQQLRGAGRRAGAGVEQRDADFASRERLVQHREIADHDREEAEPQARFDDGEHSGERSLGRDIAEPQREEGRAAQVDVGREAGRFVCERGG